MNNLTHKSFWVDTARTAARSFPTLTGNAGHVDVAVIGAGIFGLSTAARLAEAGMNVGVVEAKEVGKGVTGYSTAKLSSLHNVKYESITSKFGTEAAAKYAHMNQLGLESIAANVKKYNIECNFKRVDNCTFTWGSKNVDTLRQEADWARNAGLAIEFKEGTPSDLPFETLAYIRLPDQARFNSYTYCTGLAEALEDQGLAKIYENSRVVKIKRLRSDDRDERGPYRVKTAEGGYINADYVVIATHLPFTDISGHFSFNKPVCSYCMAFEVDTNAAERLGAPLIEHMYINPDTPSLSVRPAEGADGRPVIVVASGGHNTAEWPTGDARDQYTQTEDLARAKLPYLGAELGRWMAEDFSPVDQLPYIGYLNRFTKRLFTATGFNKWGLAAAGGASIIVHDLITGRENDWGDIFDARRWDIAHSIPQLAMINLKVGAHFVGDRVKHLVSSKDIEDLVPDSGAICRHKGSEVAAYRDQEGHLHTLSPLCTHLGCHVRWNTAERSWDCPCHGSRFTYEGEVLHGPAVRPMKKIELQLDD